MTPFKINKLSGNLEVLAKIADSMVRDYGCRLKYDKGTGRVSLIGEQYCQAVVEEVVTDSLQSNFVGL